MVMVESEVRSAEHTVHIQYQFQSELVEIGVWTHNYGQWESKRVQFVCWLHDLYFSMYIMTDKILIVNVSDGINGLYSPLKYTWVKFGTSMGGSFFNTNPNSRQKTYVKSDWIYQLNTYIDQWMYV